MTNWRLVALVVSAFAALMAASNWQGEDALRLTGVPNWETLEPPLSYAVVDVGPVASDGVRVEIFEIHHLSRGRLKRIFVGVPEGATGKVIAAFNASDSSGGAARNLVWPREASRSIESRWPVRSAGRFHTPFIAPDSPLFGAFEYTPDGPQDVLVDDMQGLEVGLDFLRGRGIAQCGPILSGGLSWGATRAMLLAAAVPDVTHVYAASGQLETSWWDEPTEGLGPVFVPQDWVRSGWDYPDLLEALDASVRLTYGDPSRGEYMWRESAPGLLERLARRPHVSVHRHDEGHRIDLDDLLGFVEDFERRTECPDHGSART